MTGVVRAHGHLFTTFLPTVMAIKEIPKLQYDNKNNKLYQINNAVGEIFDYFWYDLDKSGQILTLFFNSHRFC